MLLLSQNVTPCLISSGLVSPSGCPIVGDPYVDGCFAGVQRYLARSVNMEGMSSWNTKGPCYGYNNSSTPPPNDAQVNCTPPYSACFGNYCPDKYCEMIKMLVDLNASLICRAVNPWLSHIDLQPGTEYYKGVQQLVIDINAAYDCRGLRRPIIQAGIFENIEPFVS